MTTVDFDLDVECQCGALLSATFRNATLTVETCEACADRAENAGYDRGYGVGLADGRAGE